MSYFVTTCGSAENHEDEYLANFEDDFGNATHKFLIFYAKFLPIKDDHNRMRQIILMLERKWIEKDF